ncbi:MAG: hypothetical protein C0490_00440 [Marivirga sp.]|nr:hypothetical protein [Marivirga sp.]
MDMKQKTKSILKPTALQFKVGILFGLFVFNMPWSFAQQGSTVIPSNVRAVNTIERLTDSNGLGTNEMMYGIPLPEGKVIGDTYLSPEWKRSAILLYEGNKLLEGYPVRYDIKADELDVKTQSGVKVLSGRNVKSFIWIDSVLSEPNYFINAKEYKLDGVTLSGFFEVLVDGKSPLFKKMLVTIKKADYNVQLSIGSRDDKIIKNPEFYCAVGNKVTEIPAGKKKLLPMFNAVEGEMEKFIDENALSPKKEEDLVKIFTYYNALIKN